MNARQKKTEKWIAEAVLHDKEIEGLNDYIEACVSAKFEQKIPTVQTIRSWLPPNTLNGILISKIIHKKLKEEI